MRRGALPAAIFLAAAVVIAETAMRPSAAERRALYGLFLGGMVGTLGLAWLIRRAVRRVRTLRASVLLPPLASLGAVAVVVGAAALTMFISPHDLQLVLVALLFGVGLGGFLGAVLGDPLARDLGRLADAAAQVAGGDLTASIPVDRSDEVGRVAASFNEMVRRLAGERHARERQEQSRRAFLTGVGHDLRTPLTSLQAAVEALEDGVAPDPDRYLRSMAGDLKALRGLVDDLFVLARIEAGDVELRPVPVDLGELADEVLESMRPLAAVKSVELSLAASSPHPARADPQALARVIRNLVDNAVRHAPPGSSVVIEVAESSEGVVVTVIDAGEGFATPGEIPIVADGGRSGLGLPIARSLVEAHQGRVWVEAGRGGRVSFSVPSESDDRAPG